MKKITFLMSALLFATPVIAHGAGENIINLVGVLGRILAMLVPILVALALLYFIWGLAMFIKGSGNEDAKDEGKRKMIWGIIALFVIISIWGIINFIGRAVGVRQDDPASSPNLPLPTQEYQGSEEDGDGWDYTQTY